MLRTLNSLSSCCDVEMFLQGKFFHMALCLFLSTRWLTTKFCTIRWRTTLGGIRAFFFWRAFISILFAWWYIHRRSKRSVFGTATAVLLDDKARDWGDVVVVLLELCWFLRRFHISSTTAKDFNGFQVGIALRTLLFGRIFAKFEDLGVVHVGDQIFRWTTNSECPLQSGNNLQGVKISVEKFKTNWECLDRHNQQMTLKPVPTSGRSKVTSSIVITMNLEFNSTYRRKKHSPFNWDTLMLQGLLKLIWMCYKRNELTITEMSIRANICQIRAEDLQSSLFWKRSLQKDTCGPVRDWQRFKRLPDHIMHGQKYGRKLVKPLRIEKNKKGQKKS